MQTHQSYTGTILPWAKPSWPNTCRNIAEPIQDCSQRPWSMARLFTRFFVAESCIHLAQRPPDGTNGHHGAAEKTLKKWMQSVSHVLKRWQLAALPWPAKPCWHFECCWNFVPKSLLSLWFFLLFSHNSLWINGNDVRIQSWLATDSSICLGWPFLQQHADAGKVQLLA